MSYNLTLSCLLATPFEHILYLIGDLQPEPSSSTPPPLLATDLTSLSLLFSLLSPQILLRTSIHHQECCMQNESSGPLTFCWCLRGKAGGKFPWIMDGPFMANIGFWIEPKPSTFKMDESRGHTKSEILKTFILILCSAKCEIGALGNDGVKCTSNEKRKCHIDRLCLYVWSIALMSFLSSSI